MLEINEIKRLVDLTDGWEYIICDQSETEKIVPHGLQPFYTKMKIRTNDLIKPSWIKIYYPLLLSQACDQLKITPEYDPMLITPWIYILRDPFFMDSWGTDQFYDTANEAREGALKTYLSEND